MNAMEKLEQRYKNLKKQFEQMVESNTKIVDEKRILKNDIKVLIRYILYPDLVEKEVVDNTIEYYRNQFNVTTENSTRGD